MANESPPSHSTLFDRLHEALIGYTSRFMPDRDAVAFMQASRRHLRAVLATPRLSSPLLVERQRRKNLVTQARLLKERRRGLHGLPEHPAKARAAKASKLAINKAAIDEISRELKLTKPDWQKLKQDRIDRLYGSSAGVPPANSCAQMNSHGVISGGGGGSSSSGTSPQEMAKAQLDSARHRQALHQDIPSAH